MFPGVCLSTGGGACSGGAWSWGVPAPRGCLVGGGACSWWCLLWGAWSRGVPAPRGAWSRGPAPGGCLLGGRGLLWGVPGGDPPWLLLRAMYWNAFLFVKLLSIVSAIIKIFYLQPWWRALLNLSQYHSCSMTIMRNH